MAVAWTAALAWTWVTLPAFRVLEPVPALALGVFPGLALGVGILALVVTTAAVRRRAGAARGTGGSGSSVCFAGVACVSRTGSPGPDAGPGPGAPGDPVRILYRAGRHRRLAAAALLLALGLAGVGAGLAGGTVGWAGLTAPWRALLGVHFALAGYGLLGLALYRVGNSLEVTVARGRLAVVRRCLGLTVGRWELGAAVLDGFRVDGGNRLRAEGGVLGGYRVRALLRDGRRVVVAEGLGDRGAALALGRQMSAWLGLSGRAARRFAA